MEIIPDPRIAIARAAYADLTAARAAAVERMSPTRRHDYDTDVTKAAKALARIRDFKAKGNKHWGSTAVWTAATPYRMADIEISGQYIDQVDWQRSHTGVMTALFILDEILLLTTADELTNIEVCARWGKRQWGWRKVEMSRGSAVHAVLIDSVLTGNTLLLNDAEKTKIHAKMVAKQKKSSPMGIATNQHIETASTKAMHNLIGLYDFMEAEFITEFRLCDVVLRRLGNDDPSAYSGDQTKCANSAEGRVKFSTTVGDARLIIGGGNFLSKTSREVVAVWQRMSLTLIGLTAGVPMVVWYLRGQEALDMLAQFPDEQIFQPQLYLKNSSKNAFTTNINQPNWRFDIGSGREARGVINAVTAADERTRLLHAILEFTTGNFVVNKSLRFWNCDKTQIPLSAHKKEQDTFDRIEGLLAPFGAVLFRDPADNYGPTDFRVFTTTGKNVRIQSKMVHSKCRFAMHGNTGLPYNLMIDFDSLDIFDASTDVVYSLPARVPSTIEGAPTPYLSSGELSRGTVNLSVSWKTCHAPYRCDLRTSEGVLKYIRLQDERA